MARSTQSLLDDLGLRLEDSGEDVFTASIKREMLTAAQLEITGLVNHSFLTELEKTVLAVTVTAGVTADLGTALTPWKLLGGGQGVLAVRDATLDRWATPFDVPRDIKKDFNRYIKGDIWNPKYTVFENKIWMIPTTITSIDVKFLRVPTDLYAPLTITIKTGGADTDEFVIDTFTGISAANDYYNGAVIYSVTHGTYHVISDYVGSSRATTVVPALATGTFATGETIYFLTHTFDTLNLSALTCELNPVLHDALLDLAEAKCWRSDHKDDREEKALRQAEIRLKSLNAQFRNPVGMGTDDTILRQSNR
jgi:hypothetical protein